MNFIVNLLILLPARIASYFAWAGPLIMRLIVGYVFMMSGWGKLNNLPQMIQDAGVKPSNTTRGGTVR